LELKVFDLIAAVGQRFPTYSIFNYCFDRGCIGGSYPDQEEDGRRAGEIAARVLSGEKPEDIPVQAGPAMRPMLDCRQLQHWKIPESFLPPGTVVLYRPERFWQRYRWQLELGIVLLLGLIFLGVHLLFERARRRRAERRVARQLRFETLISQISSELVNASPTQIRSDIPKSLASLREFLGVDRISIFKLDDNEGILRLRHSARAEGTGASPEFLRGSEYPWLFAQLVGTEPVVTSELDRMPNEAKAELNYFP